MRQKSEIQRKKKTGSNFEADFEQLLPFLFCLLPLLIRLSSHACDLIVCGQCWAVAATSSLVFVAGQHWTVPHNLQLDCGLPLCLCFCECVCVWLPQDILPLDYALKLLFMFMEIVFRPTVLHAHAHYAPNSCFCFVPHNYRVCPIRPDYPHFVRLIVGFDFVASARLLWPQFIYLFSTSLSLSLFLYFVLG